MPNGYTSVLKAGQTLIPLKAKEVFPNRSDRKLIHEVLVYSSSKGKFTSAIKVAQKPRRSMRFVSDHVRFKNPPNSCIWQLKYF